VVLAEAGIFGEPVQAARLAEVEPAEAAAYRDVGKRVALGVAPLALAEVRRT
jgi:hypothetical protein